MQSLAVELSRLGLSLSITEKDFNGSWIRDDDEWFKGTIHTINGKRIFKAVFGSWKTGDKGSWASDEFKNLTEAEQKEFNEDIEREQEENKRATEEKWTTVKKLAQSLWDEASDRGTHDYLSRKGLHRKDLYGCRIILENNIPVLLVPMRDLDGKLWNLTKIYPSGDKRYLKGAKKQGLFHTIGEDWKRAKRLWLCEGMSTGASISEALSASEGTVIICFDAGNLVEVAKGFKDLAGHGWEFAICADDDFKNSPNTGILYAHKANAILGGRVSVPGSGLNDFNDLHLAKGINAVKEALHRVPEPTQFTEYNGEIVQLPSKENKEWMKAEKKKDREEAAKEKEKLHPATVTRKLLGIYKENLLTQEDVIFEYTGTHWAALSKSRVKELHREVNETAEMKLSFRDIKNYYEHFCLYINEKPNHVNFLAPMSNYANFLDGTLELKRDLVTSRYSTTFRPHRKEDYLTWVVPLHYKIDRTVKNSLFEKLLCEVFEGDEDGEAKINSLKQMAGAMLLPTFPQMFFLTGVSGSRKSTIVKTLLKLLQPDGDTSRVSMIDPCRMGRAFNLQGMIGKLANINTDINDSTPIQTDVLKSFTDGLPQAVEVKFKDLASARLPMLHVYCCNRLPPNAEQSRAFERRMTIIEFTRDLTHGSGVEKPILYYEDMIYKHSPEGILNFALDGLEMLIANGGNFTVPASSKKRVQEWPTESDPIGLFLLTLTTEGIHEAGCEVRMAKKDNEKEKHARIKTGELWTAFCIWVKASYPNRYFQWGRPDFYKRADMKLNPRKKVEGHWYYDGILVIDLPQQ